MIRKRRPFSPSERRNSARRRARINRGLEEALRNRLGDGQTVPIEVEKFVAHSFSRRTRPGRRMF